MEKYNLFNIGDEVLLCEDLENEYARKVVDRAKSANIECKGQVICLGNVNDRWKIYVFYSEERQNIKCLLENVCQYLVLGTGEHRYFLYRKDLEFFLLKLQNFEEVALGSWQMYGMFLSGPKDAFVARFFENNKLQERNYVKCDIRHIVWQINYYINCSWTVVIAQRQDGLYDIKLGAKKDFFKDNPNVETDMQEYICLKEDAIENACQIFWFDRKKQACHLLFEGTNELEFGNAVLEKIMSSEDGNQETEFLLSYFDGMNKILLARSNNPDEVEWDNRFVQIAGKRWSAMTDNKHRLKREPEEVPEQVVIEESPEEHQSISLVGEDVPKEVKKGFWHRLFG